MNVTIDHAVSHSDIEFCFAIRRKVFIEGQNVPEKDEIDGLDHESEHYILKVDQRPVGTSRVRLIDDQAKIERFSILSDDQGKGLGKKLLRYILEELQNDQQIKKIMLSAQTHAIPFYENMGFVICSDTYMDAGIPHKDMKLSTK